MKPHQELVVLAAGLALAVAGTLARAETRATAQLNPTAEHNVSGTVTFEAVEGGVHILAQVTGLTPGKHGFHVHDKGDCSAPDASSAGGHFNPHGCNHGGPDAEVHHPGDFGNLEADASGIAHYDRVDKLIQLDGPDSIVGRALIVHEKEDDLVTQPTGNAGARVACGVIHGEPSYDDSSSDAAESDDAAEKGEEGSQHPHPPNPTDE